MRNKIRYFDVISLLSPSASTSQPIECQQAMQLPVRLKNSQAATMTQRVLADRSQPVQMPPSDPDSNRRIITRQEKNSSSSPTPAGA